MYKRATSLADAFITATANKMKTEKVDHQSGAGNWIARRVVLNATERGQFGMTTEYDKRPTPPKMRATLEHEEDFSDVPY